MKKENNRIKKFIANVYGQELEFNWRYEDIYSATQIPHIKGLVDYEYDSFEHSCTRGLTEPDMDGYFDSTNCNIEILSEYYIIFCFNNDIHKIPITFTEFMDDFIENNGYDYWGTFEIGDNEYQFQINHNSGTVSIFYKDGFEPLAHKNFTLIEKIV